MGLNEKNFELSRNIEHYLAALAKLYGKEGLKEEQELIVNAKVRVHEEWSYDNWNGGTYGHALYFELPESLYLRSVKDKDSLQNKFKEDINRIQNCQNEFIEQVFLELEKSEDLDWRKDSGLLLTRRRAVVSEVEKRIWGDDGFRVFFTHKAEVKKQTADLKTSLSLFGVSCFVAHEDILPTKEWQTEIENALCSMDALVALMTADFHDSLWTDQEVGFAFGRGVPIISIKLGKDPYGFIGKFQALSCSWDTADKEIVKILINNNQMLNSYIKAIMDCGSFENGNKLSEILPSISNISDHQASNFISAFNENIQVRDGFGFNGKKPIPYGEGLVCHLRRLTGRKYKYLPSGKIVAEP